MKNDKARKEAFDALYGNAKEALMDMRLLDGFTLMRSIQKDLGVDENAKSAYGQMLDMLESDYRAMLRFIASNGRDNDADRVQMDIVRRSLEMLMRMHRHIRMDLAYDVYGIAAQKWSKASMIEIIMARLSYEDAVTDLGYANTVLTRFWISDFFSKEDRERLEGVLEQVPPDWLTVVLGGLYLSLTEYFDPQKYILIHHFTASVHPTIRVDCTVYLLLIHIMKADYVRFSSNLPKFGLDKRTLSCLRAAHRAMLVQAESPKCSSIVAERVKKTVETQGGSYGIVNQIIELPIPTQIDFNYGSFIPVYGSEFFRSNPVLWWLPFNINYPFLNPSVKSVRKDSNSAIRSIFCDVDKFAICECLKKGTLPNANTAEKKKDSSNLFAQILFLESTELSDLCSLRMQNLYRFYTYCIWSRQMDNPFNHNLYVAGKEELAPYFTEEERHLLLHSLMMMHDYKLSLVVVDDMIARYRCDSSVYRAKGICHQHFKEYEIALHAYRQAFLLNETDVWTIAHMQECYERLGMRAEVVDCLQNRLLLQPQQEDVLTAQLARTYKEMEQYENALACYYKMYYKDAGNTEASGGVVWCLFMLKKYDKARTEVESLAENTVGLTDYEYLVAGHLDWATGHLKSAIEHYESFFSLYRCRKGREESSPWNILEWSEPVLAKHGISHARFRLMMDILRKKIL